MRLDAHLICLMRNNFHLVVQSSPLAFSLRMDARHRYREIAMRQNVARELFWGEKSIVVCRAVKFPRRASKVRRHQWDRKLPTGNAGKSARGGATAISR